MGRARRERETAALDLSDAAQAALRAVLLVEAGETTAGSAASRLAARLYEGAARHQQRASTPAGPGRGAAR